MLFRNRASFYVISNKLSVFFLVQQKRKCSPLFLWFVFAIIIINFLCSWCGQSILRVKRVANLSNAFKSTLKYFHDYVACLHTHTQITTTNLRNRNRMNQSNIVRRRNHEKCSVFSLSEGKTCFIVSLYSWYSRKAAIGAQYVCSIDISFFVVQQNPNETLSMEQRILWKKTDKMEKWTSNVCRSEIRHDNATRVKESKTGMCIGMRHGKRECFAKQNEYSAILFLSRAITNILFYPLLAPSTTGLLSLIRSVTYSFFSFSYLWTNGRTETAKKKTKNPSHSVCLKDFSVHSIGVRSRSSLDKRKN